MTGRILLTILMPVVVIGGYVLAFTVGGFVQSSWEDFLGPFLFTYWAGLGFTNAWFFVRQSMHIEGFTPGMQAATAGLIIIVFLFMLDGPTAFFDDPWLIGVVIAPGMDLILPYLRERLHRTTGTVDEDEDAATSA